MSVSTVMGKITEDPWTTQKVERNASVGTWMDHTNTCTTPRGNTLTHTYTHTIRHKHLHHSESLRASTLKATHMDKLHII